MKSEEYKTYPYRWVVLGVYGLAAGVIQLLWTTFFSITTASWHYYGFSDAVSGENAISLLSIIFMAGMILFSIPVLAIFEKYGFKKSVGFGTVLMGICALLRGIFGYSYLAVVLTTVGFSIAQPFLLNSPGLVAGKWFPESERATANSIGLLSGYIGMCVGLLLTPVLLTNGLSIRGILIAYGIVGAVSALLFVALAKEKPPTPPCPTELSIRSDFKSGARSVFKNKNFIFAGILFFCMLGVFNTFFTMIEPILRQLSSGTVGTTQSGLIGVIILMGGIVGSFIVSLLSDRDRLHRRLPYLIASCLIGTAGFAVFLFSGNFSGMIAAAVLYGFFTVGAAPLILTFAAESVYPTSEGTSEGLLMFLGNVAGVVFLAVFSIFQGHHRAMMLVMTAVMAACILLLFFMRESKLEPAASKELDGV
jgi:MFS family permease